MTDNLALKLLVAGIIGAVVGAAAAERYHFPAGLVRGDSNRLQARRPIDATIGRGDREEGSRIVIESPPDYYYRPPPPRYLEEPSRPPRYLEEPPPPPRYLEEPPPPPRTAWCWRKVEDWNFRTASRWVRCPPGAGRRERDI